MSNTGGPWGGRGSGGRGGGGGDDRRGGGGRRPGGGEGPQIPEIDDLVRKGQEQLRVLMGGRGGGNGGRGTGGGGGIPKRGILLGLVALVALWAFASFYTVRPEERSVELLFGSYHNTGSPGLNFAPW